MKSASALPFFDESFKGVNKLLHSGILLLLFASFLSATACQGDTQTQFRLTSRERAQVDTIFSRQVDSLRLALDSLCTIQQDEMMESVIDSLLEARKADEEKLRKRILQKQ